MSLRKLLRTEYDHLTPAQALLVEHYVITHNALDDIEYVSEVYDLIDDALDALSLL